jgi:RNA polymerase sigma factor (sigma-70 family)
LSAAELVPPSEVQVLYSDHHGWLYSWLRRRLGCSHNAADLAHDTYMRLMVSGRQPAPEQARSYLMQIAKGLVIDRHRREVLERAYLDALACQPQAMSPSPEERSMAIEALMRIDAMLGRLAPIVRETFLLSQFDGLTYSAIAEQLGVSVASVRKYMLQAMQACMDALDDA